MRACGATIASKDHLAHARVVAASFRRHHPGIPFHVLLADEVDGWFDPAREPYELIELGALDAPDVAALRFRHPKQPFSYALLPTLLKHLLDRGYERVLFVKQESLVLGSLTSELERLDADEILLTPHLLDPLEGPDRSERERTIILSGAFNLGFLGVAEGPSTRAMLAWWADRLARHCRHAVGEGMHYEQRWATLVPTLFERVGIVRDPGLNVGHWNLHEREIRVDGDTVTAAGRPARLVRFSGYRPEEPERTTRYNDRLARDELGDARALFDRFRAALLDAGHEEVSRWPYAYDRFADGVAIPDLARELHGAAGSVAEALGDPFATGPGTFRAWLCEPEPGETVPRLLRALYERRADVRAAYPDALRPGDPALAAWFRSSGAAEHDIDPRLLAAPA